MGCGRLFEGTCVVFSFLDGLGPAFALLAAVDGCQQGQQELVRILRHVAVEVAQIFQILHEGQRRQGRFVVCREGRPYVCLQIGGHAQREARQVSFRISEGDAGVLALGRTSDREASGVVCAR